MYKESWNLSTKHSFRVITATPCQWNSTSTERRLPVVCCIWMLILAWITSASHVTAADRNQQPDPRRPFRENATLPVDSSLLKQFGTVEDLLTDQRWSEAIAILQEIAQTESKELILVRPGQPGDVANYLNVAARCNVLLSRISPQGRAIYRKKVDPQAKRWFENWQRTHDDKELMRIVRQAYLSSHADDALLALGDVGWDRGDFSAARLWWQQLLPLPNDADASQYPTVLRYPDSSIEPAAVFARLVLCSIVSNESIRAREELRQFAEQYPAAEGWLAGRRGRFVEILQRISEEAKAWQTTASPIEVATFGLSAARFHSLPDSTDVGAFRWNQPLPRNLLPQKNSGSPFTTEPLSYHPVVYDKIVFVNDANSIHAWNIFSGEPAWKSEGRDPTTIYPSVPDEPKVISKSDCIGSPHYTMTIAENRLYARMGSPVTCAAASEMRPEFSSDLVCLDLNQEGKLVWKLSANDLLPDTAPWRFEGSPAVDSGRAYVALCRRNPQLEMVIVAMDAADGRLLWQQSIGTSRLSMDENTNRVSHQLLTVGGGRVFLSTDAGVIVALDALDGRMEWAVSYESRNEEVTAAISDLSRKTLHPPLFHSGLLFVAPADAAAAYCIEADSGRIRWKFPFLDGIPNTLPDNIRRNKEVELLRSRQWRHLLGIGPGGLAGRLIVSGSSLWAIDIETGTIAWPTKERAFPRGSNAEFGRGVIAGNQVLIPLRESIEIFDVESGDQVRSVPLKSPESPQLGGNLTLAYGMLLVAQPTQLAAYSDFSRLKEQLEKKLIQRPDDFRSRIQLADFERVEGSLDAAIQGFRTVLEMAGTDQPAYFTARRKLTTLYQQLGSAKLNEKKIDEAKRNWSEAISLADDITQRVDLIFDLSRVEEALEQPAAAVTRLQEILFDKGLASVRRFISTAGDHATGEIWRLIQKHGRGIYETIESRATDELERLTKQKDLRGLQEMLSQYPHAAANVSARRLAVKWYCDAGLFPEAFAILDQTRISATDDETYVQAIASMISILERRNSRCLVHEACRELKMFDPSIQIEFDEARTTVAKVLEASLSAPVPKMVPNLIERTWHFSLPADAIVVIPQGTPPNDELAAFFISTRNESPSNTWTCQCRDWSSGQIRWQETVSSPATIAGWTAVHLMIGTEHHWYGRTAEDGRAVWTQTSLGVTEPLFIQPSSTKAILRRWPAFFDKQFGMRIFDPFVGRMVSGLRSPRQPVRFVSDGRPVYFTRQFGASDNPIEPIQILAGNSPRNELQGAFQIYILTEKPTHLWHASASAPFFQWGWQSISEGAVRWQGQLGLENHWLTGVTADRSLIGINTTPGSYRMRSRFETKGNIAQRENWIFRNLPHGSVDPFAFRWFGKLLVVADGTQLASFDPTTGKRNWSTGLSDVPLVNPAQQICADNHHVYATNQGILRSISIDDGRRTRSTYLGNASEQWRTVNIWSSDWNSSAIGEPAGSESPEVMETLLAAWPVEKMPSIPVMVAIYHPKTGEVVQRILADGCPREFQINESGDGIFCTDATLSGLRFSTATSVAKRNSSTPPSDNSRP